MKTTSINKTLEVAEINLHLNRLFQQIDYLEREQSDLKKAIYKTTLDPETAQQTLLASKQIDTYIRTLSHVINNLHNYVNPF